MCEKFCSGLLKSGVKMRRLSKNSYFCIVSVNVTEN